MRTWSVHGRLNRRLFLRAGMLAGLMAAGLPGKGWSASKRMRFLTPEADPPQIDVWKELLAAYEAKNSDVKVEGEYTKWDDLVKKVATDLATKNPPELVVGGSSPAFTYEQFKQGYLVELSEVVETIGREDFIAGDLGSWQTDGNQMAIPYGSQGVALWYRKDLLEEKGLKVPRTWEDFLTVAEKTTDAKKGFFGTVFPYGRTWNTDIHVTIFVWNNGGFIFDDKLNVVFDSPETHAALKFYKEMARFSPPDAGTYGFREATNAFVSGQAATILYAGRVLSHLHRMAPNLVGKSGAVPIPYNKVLKSGLFHDEVFVYKTGNAQEALELVKVVFQPEWVKRILWTVPGHVIPSQKSMMAGFLEHPWLQQSPDIANTFAEMSRYAVTAVKESPDHPFNYKWNVIDGNRVMAECVQRIIIGGEAIPKAVSWAHKRMVELTKDLKG